MRQLTCAQPALPATAGAVAASPKQLQPSGGSQRPAAGAAASSSSSQQQPPHRKSKLLLIDDLPYTGDAERRQRLVRSLRDLACTARCPVIIIATDQGGGSGGGGGGGGMYGNAAMGTSKGLHKVRSCAQGRGGPGRRSAEQPGGRRCLQ